MPIWITEAYPLFVTWGFVVCLDVMGAVLMAIFSSKNVKTISENFVLEIRMVTRVIFTLWVMQSVMRLYF